MCCNSAFLQKARKEALERLFVFVLSEDSFAILVFHLSTRLVEICERRLVSPRQGAFKEGENNQKLSILYFPIFHYFGQNVCI